MEPEEPGGSAYRDIRRARAGRTSDHCPVGRSQAGRAFQLQTRLAHPGEVEAAAVLGHEQGISQRMGEVQAGLADAVDCERFVGRQGATPDAKVIDRRINIKGAAAICINARAVLADVDLEGGLRSREAVDR